MAFALVKKKKKKVEVLVAILGQRVYLMLCYKRHRNGTRTRLVYVLPVSSPCPYLYVPTIVTTAGFWNETVCVV